MMLRDDSKRKPVVSDGLSGTEGAGQNGRAGRGGRALPRRRRCMVSGLLAGAVAAVVAVAVGVFAVGLPFGTQDCVAGGEDAAAAIEQVEDRATCEGWTAGATSGDAVDKSDAVTTDAEGVEYVSERVLITFDASVDETALRQNLEEQGVAVQAIDVVSVVSEDNEVIATVDYTGGADAKEVSERLEQSGAVGSVQPDYLMELVGCEDADEDDVAASEGAAAGEDATASEAAGELASTDATSEDAELCATTNDPLISKQWGLQAAKFYGAWNSAKASGKVTVAVLDSGVDVDHPDLKDNLVLAYAKNFSTGKTGAAAVNDTIGHGTEVAGVIAAEAGNGIGTAGGSYNAKILPLKVTSSGTKVPTSQVIDAIEYCIDMKSKTSVSALANIRVINASFAGKAYDAAYEEAVARATEAGILVVSAMGNWGSAATTYPSAYEGVVGVSALKDNGKTGAFDASYSSYGANVDVAAPGTSVYTTKLNGKYGAVSGTSISAPMVSAAAALAYSVDKTMTPAQVTQMITQTANGSKWTKYLGYGTLNAKALVSRVKATWLGQASVTYDKVVAYTGKAACPTVTVTLGGKTLTAGSAYEVTYSNNTAPGTGTITITGLGTYHGKRTFTFTISSKSLSAAMMAEVAAQSYTGSAICPRPKVTFGGKTLVYNTNYTLAYYNAAGKKVTSPTNVGTYTVKATGKGNYTGTISTTFTIVPQNVTGTARVGKSKSFTVTWDEIDTQCGGYQVRYALNSSMSGAVTKKVASRTKTSLSVTGLKAQTTYYVQVRAYQVVSGKTYYGNWSTAKAVKTTS